MGDNALCVSREESAAIKGALMMLIVLGHNQFLEGVLGTRFWNWLYSFHVAGFFILPFFYPANTFSWERVKTNFVRLYWPFIWAFSLLTLIRIFLNRFGLLTTELPEYLPVLSVGGFFRTLATGNFWALSPYCGFFYLWFLPAMFSMTVLRGLYDSRKMWRVVLLSVGLICYVYFWVLMYDKSDRIPIKFEIMQWSPFAMLQGCGMLFLGILSRGVLARMRWNRWVFVGLFVFIGVVYFSFSASNPIFFPYKCFLWVVNPILAFGLLLGFRAIIAEWKLFRKIGGLSLPVYLIHQPLNIACCMLIRRLLPGEDLFCLLISYCIVLALSIVLAGFLARTKLYGFLFPRYFPVFSNKHN